MLNIFSGGVIGKIVEGVSGYFTRKSEERTAVAAIKAKVDLARVNKESRLELAGHELQVLRTQGAGGSWKDEFVTLLVSVPIIVSMAGALITVYDPYLGGRLMEAAHEIALIMTGDSIDFAELWLIVVATALGTKPFRR